MLTYSLNNDNDQLFPFDAATLFAFVECYDHKILMLQHYLHLLIVMITKSFYSCKKYQRIWHTQSWTNLKLRLFRH